ncbi:hypothetical protein HDU79_001573 [Rhizoclosmatium sp. JEL0117]|nr:hypothetical protein HDU79_001573 [Rhizoclosmatium sp. JEL0117]
MKIISGDTYSATPKPTPKLLLLIMSRSALSLSSTLIDSVYTSFTHTVLKSRNATIDSAAAKEALAAQTAAKRNKLIIVTAGGGTVPSATSGISYSRRSTSNTPDAAIKEHADLDPRNLQVLKRGKGKSGEWRGIAQSLALRFVVTASSRLCTTVRRYIKETRWMDDSPVDTVDGRWGKEVLGAVKGIDDKLKIVYEEEREGGRRLGGPPSLHVSGSASVSPNRNMNKIGKSGSGVFSGSSNASSASPQFGKVAKLGSVGSGNGGGKFDALLDNIDRMFDERADYFKNLDMSRDGILSALLKIVVKCYIEKIRMQTLGPTGLHRVQVDSAVLKRMLRTGSFGMISEDGLLNSMAEDMITSGMRRCVDPIMLGPEDIDNIVSSVASPTRTEVE